MKNIRTSCFIAAAMAAGAASAQVVDGQLDAVYGAVQAIQNTQTGFGDSNLGLIDFANGSELDNLYVRRTATDLYIFLGGNLEGGPSTFNKVAIFVDSVPGGYNRLPSDLPDIDFNRLIRMGDDGSGNGLTFDAGFEADYFFGMVAGGNPVGLYFNFAEIKKVADGGIAYYMGTTVPGTGTLSGGTNPFGAEYTLNNVNVAGVPGGIGTDPGNGAGVATGMECKIPLAQIGNPGGNVKICVFVFNDDFNFLSNQVLPGIGGGDNLANPLVVNFENIPGPQCLVIPGSAPEVVVPSSFTTIRGRLDSGNVASLASDDNSYLRHCKFIVPNTLVPPIEVQVNGTTTKASTTGVTAQLTGKMANAGSFSHTVEQRNQVTLAYEDGATATVNVSESTVTSNSTGNHNEKIGSGGALQAKYFIRRTGPSAVAAFCYDAEWFRWTVN